MDAASRITGSEQTVLAGACSGGIIAAMVAARLAHADQQDRIAALTPGGWPGCCTSAASSPETGSAS
jgi:hypothetical protein